MYHTNLSAIQTEFDKIIQIADSLQRLCLHIEEEYNLHDEKDQQESNSTIFRRECGSSYDQIRITIENMQEFHTEWFFSHNDARPKRAPLNIVGSVLRSLFGTLSQEDAERYMSQFTKMEQENNDRKVEIDQQTTLLRSTVQVISNMHNQNTEWQQETTAQIDKVYKLLGNLTNSFDDVWHNLQLQFLLENLFITLSMAITAFSNNQRRILDAMSIGAHNSETSPILLPPAILYNELNSIQNQLAGQELELPLEIKRDNMLNFYRMAYTRSRILNNQLIVDMSIPLLKPIKLELIKATSFPNLLGNGMYNFILPSHEFVAIDTFREEYITLTSEELAKCHDLRDISDDGELICSQSSPLFKVSTQRDDCTIAVLSNLIEAHSCDRRIANISSSIWLTLRQQNAWLVVFPSQQILYVRCSNAPTTEILVNGTGIVLLKQDCQIKTDELVLQAHTTYRSEIYNQIIPIVSEAWNANLTLKLLDHFDHKTIRKVSSPDVISHGDRDKLKQISSSISELLEIPTKVPTIYAHHLQTQSKGVSIYTIIAITLTIICLNATLLFLYDKFRTFTIKLPQQRVTVNSANETLV